MLETVTPSQPNVFWKGNPFRPISEFYHNKFGEKVYKIPVSIVDTCPNREGLKGMETCIFCDVWGSAAKAESFDLSLTEQIEKYHQSVGTRFNAKSFLVYFQAYTNTFTKLDHIKQSFETAMQYPFVKGFVVGTRPDCISLGVMKFWEEYHQRKFVAVELGVQTFSDEGLKFLKRGHTHAQTLKAIDQITKHTSVNLGIHLIFGLPNETEEQIIETAKLCNQLPISNVKLHHLHVLKNTPLEKIYHEGNFIPPTREEYARKVQVFLEHLSPHIYVHRLAAFASRWDELVAPAYTTDKMGTHQFLVDHLKGHHAYQGKQFKIL